jgi:ankyrin repeat protein
VDISANQGFTRTPLQLATEKGNIKIVEELLNHFANVNAAPNDRYGATALQFAAIGGYVGIAKLLLQNCADVNAAPAKIGGRTALEAAAEHGRLDMVQLLMNWGAEITGRGQEQYETAVALAKNNGHMALSRLLERSHTWQSTFMEPGASLLQGFSLDADWVI